MLKKTIIVILLVMTGSFFQFCGKKNSGDVVLFHFENDAELDRLNWKCRTLFSLSDAFYTEGEKSLQVELYPSDYPGISFKKFKRDWGKYKRLCFDVYNPMDKNINLVVRIDDTPHSLNYNDRYNRRFNLVPGRNNIMIPLSGLKTPGGQRSLNVSGIDKFIIFAVRPEKKIQLFLDHIRLEN